MLVKPEWNKPKGMTGKLDPSPQFLAEEKKKSSAFRETYQH